MRCAQSDAHGAPPDRTVEEAVLGDSSVKDHVLRSENNFGRKCLPLYRSTHFLRGQEHICSISYQAMYQSGNRSAGSSTPWNLGICMKLRSSASLIRSGTLRTALAFLANVERRRSKGVAANAARGRPASRERGGGWVVLVVQQRAPWLKRGPDKRRVQQLRGGKSAGPAYIKLYISQGCG